VSQKPNFQVSVIIPAYNNGNYLSEAIESVLDQTYPAFELIVVDSSTDETSDIAKKYSPPVHYIFQKKSGIGKARNMGIKLSRGNYFAHLDADDIWVPEKLALQKEAFLKNSNVDITGGHIKPFFSPEISREHRKRIDCSPEPLPGFSASALVIKKEAFFQAGWYPENWNVGQDLAWFIQAREAGLKELMIPEILVWRRLHKSNTDFVNRDSGRERLLILKSALDRRRQKS
jgi:glycosyltransferase involved in cell wall biosynthesis